MYRCFGNVSGIHYLAHTILRIFSEHRLNKIRIRRYWATTAVFIFQLEVASSKFLKSIADGSNSRSITPINGTNLVYSVLCTITFFKAMKHNMPQMFLLTLHIERCRQNCKRDFVANKMYFERVLRQL